ncbi:MAG: type II toxin-antitoxin system death-on-curing family toxin [Natrialbaceae archaeon]|nr:type II toxin-antitoxin system death-on-curing family toxin [Natrialbaceae archaeon]
MGEAPTGFRRVLASDPARAIYAIPEQRTSMSAADDDLEYLSPADILAIHDLVVTSSAVTPPGVSAEGAIEYTVAYVRGEVGDGPHGIHETAYHLLRLLVANHPFVDGNKRTALLSARTFYALNGLDLEVDDRIRSILRDLATDVASVDEPAVIAYLQDRTRPLPEDDHLSYAMWREHIDGRR